MWTVPFCIYHPFFWIFGQMTLGRMTRLHLTPGFISRCQELAEPEAPEPRPLPRLVPLDEKGRWLVWGVGGCRFRMVWGWFWVG